MTTRRLDFRRSPDDGVHVVRGDLDAHTAGELADWLRRRSVDDRELRLDVGEVLFVDSAALEVLVEQSQAFRRAGRRLVLLRPGDALRRALHAARLDDQLDVEDPSPA